MTDGKVEFDQNITSKCKDIFQLAAIDDIGMQAIQKFEGTFPLRESSLTFPISMATQSNRSISTIGERNAELCCASQKISQPMFPPLQDEGIDTLGNWPGPIGPCIAK